MKNTRAINLTFALLALIGTLWPGSRSPAQEVKPTPRANDWLLIPDRRAGPITGEWTGDDLMKAFGTLHCKKEQIPVGEGESVPGYILYPGTDDELSVRLNPDTGKVEGVSVSLGFETITNPGTGQVEGSKVVPRRTRWRSISGISLGSTIGQVTEVNGKPFAISGWEWDYPGAIESWRDGKIPDSFQVRFMYRDHELYDRVWQEAVSSQTWDGASDGPIMTKLDPIVYFIWVQL